jgi:PAS domain S-box-containing protein
MEEQFRLLVENIPAAIYIQTHKCFAYLNKSAAELFGASSAEELIGTSILDRIHPSFREKILYRISQTNEQISVNPEIDEIYLKMDGTPLHVEVSAVPFLYNGENGALVFVRDISKRKLAEENLKRNADRLIKIFNVTPMGIGITVKRVLNEVNDRLCEMTGYSREELIGQSTRMLYADAEEYNSIGNQIYNKKNKEISLNIETRWRKKDGSIIYVHMRDAQIDPDLDSSVIFTAVDISGRYLHEEQIRLLGAIADSAPVSIIIHDEAGKIIYANKESFNTYKYSQDEFMRLTLHDLIGPEGAALVHSRRQKILDEGEASFEVDQQRKDGTIFPMRVNARIMEWGGRKVTLSVSTDLTEQKRVEEYVGRTQKLESLGVLAGGIAHDFNNLLGVIFGYINLAMMTSSETEVTDYLEKAVSGFKRARNLTQQLLTFSRGGAPDKKTSSIAPLIKESTQFALSGSNIICRFNIQDDLWLCDYDESQMGQLIDNIVINAKQAMPAGGTITISAVNTQLDVDKIPSLNGGKYVKLSFEDTGPGIPAEILPRIFDPFFTTKTKGNGLGLTTSYSIIKKHDGDIFVESSPGNGTTFHVYIPASLNRESGEIKHKSVEYTGSGNILIMDDEPDIRSITQKMLTGMGFAVALASDGNEALKMFKEAMNSADKFDLVMLDLTIPGGMGGEKAVRELKKLDADLIAFAMSGYSDDPVMSNPVKYGFADKLFKPFMKDDLAELLNRHSPRIQQKVNR